LEELFGIPAAPSLSKAALVPRAERIRRSTTTPVRPGQLRPPGSQLPIAAAALVMEGKHEALSGRLIRPDVVASAGPALDAAPRGDTMRSDAAHTCA